MKINHPFLLAGALICLIGILAVPVAARAPGMHSNVSEKNQIDPGLKAELWTIHMNHRLDRFDGNVETAGEVIDALDKYSYDTTALEGILDDISGKRDALEDALEARDRDALRDVNQDLLQLWKDLRQEVRQLFKGA